MINCQPSVHKRWVCVLFSRLPLLGLFKVEHSYILETFKRPYFQWLAEVLNRSLKWRRLFLPYLFFKNCFYWNIVYINFRCTAWWFNIFIDLYCLKLLQNNDCISICCTKYPCCSFMLYIGVCIFKFCISISPSPFPSPTDDYRFVSYICEFISVLLYMFIYFIF